MKQKKQKNNSDCKLSLRPVSGEKEPKQTKEIKSAKWDEERQVWTVPYGFKRNSYSCKYPLTIKK